MNHSIRISLSMIKQKVSNAINGVSGTNAAVILPNRRGGGGGKGGLSGQ